MIDRNTRCVVVGGLEENLGGLVRAIGLSLQSGWYESFYQAPGRWWDCECLSGITVARASNGKRTRVPPGTVVPFPSSILRPLRDSDGTDETFSWAGMPRPASSYPADLPAVCAVTHIGMTDRSTVSSAPSPSTQVERLLKLLHEAAHG